MTPSDQVALPKIIREYCLMVKDARIELKVSNEVPTICHDKNYFFTKNKSQNDNILLKYIFAYFFHVSSENGDFWGYF